MGEVVDVDVLLPTGRRSPRNRGDRGARPLLTKSVEYDRTDIGPAFRPTGISSVSPGALAGALGQWRVKRVELEQWMDAQPRSVNARCDVEQ